MEEHLIEVEGVLTVVEKSNANNGIVYNTLDEPIKETFYRDVKAVGLKIIQVLIPRDKKTVIREWDLWGPLILCTTLAVLLQGSSSKVSNNENKGDPQFAEVFFLVSAGAFVVTLNSKLLGGSIVCILGYCLLPSILSLIVCRIILLAKEQTSFLFALRCLIPFTAFIWASYSALIFLGNTQPKERRVLAAYPMCLFYFIICWLVVSHT